MGRYSKEYYQQNKSKIRLHHHNYYLCHKEAWKINGRKWCKSKNGIIYRKKYFKKWYDKPKNKLRMKNLMKKYYEAHKQQFISRVRTKDMIKGRGYKKITPPIYQCKNCLINKDLQLHHKIYPTKKQDIINAIKNKQIYYVCKPCHRLLHPKC